MSGSQQLLLGGAPTVTPVDPYFYSVTSLLHGDGTNGGQNNTFLDSSSNNFTITRNGNTTQGSFSPFSQTGWGAYFNGSSDYISVADSADFTMGSGDFTVQCWVYSTANSGSDQYILGQVNSTGAAAATSFQLYKKATSNVAEAYVYAGGSKAATGTAQIPVGQWTHLAMVRDGGTLRLYVNGSQDGTNATLSTTAITDSTGSFSVGRTGDYNGVYFAGYVSNVSVVKGTCLFPSGTTFTPSTTPLSTSTSGQSVLLCQANRFIDTNTATTAKTVTVGGSPSVQPFSPFNPTTAYSTSAVGGSGYFDGSGDYLQLADSTAWDLTGDYTIEMWLYKTSTTSQTFFMLGAGGSTSILLYQNASNVIIFNTSGAVITASTAAQLNAWNHIALVRSGSGSNNTTLYLNGTSVGQATNTASFTGDAANGVRIGAEYPTGFEFTGYISNLRIVKGTAVYTGAFTPPTAPPTAIANTQLLCNFTNGAIFDNAAVADYETVGNAQISTSVKKYGTGSLAFDGTGDWLLTKATTPFDLGTGDMTFECWFYITNTIADYRMLASDATNGNNYICLRGGGTGGQIEVNVAGTSFRFNLSNTVSQNTWTHLAVVRIGSTWIAYINGLSLGTNTSSGSFNLGNGGMYVGRFGGATAYEWPGYIDDLRISKGIARYPYNFTPPTAALPDIGGTVTLTADPYYEYTTLLLPGNGTNGAQNNTFLDSSTNAFSITRNGNTTQGTFSPFSQTGWGNYFDGSGDYLSLADNAAFQYGTGDFTIEFWFYMLATAGSGNYYVLYDGRPSGTSGAYVNIAINNATPESYVSGSTVITGSALSANTWYHFAYARSGTSTKMFVNGTQVGSTYTDTTNYVNGTARPVIGTNGFSVGTSNFNGYFSNYRVVKGTAVYTANFTPPTAPLTAITNTSLLTCQSNRFIDNSSNAFAITANGNVSVQAFSPFNPTASWSAATYGDSGYFDGSGDYLTVADNAALQMGSGDFTIEYWWYPNNITSYQNPIDKGYTGAGGLLLQTGNGDGRIIVYAAGSAVITSSTAVAANAWNHMALVRSGTTLTLYQNGLSVGSATNSTNFNNTATLGIGATATAPGGGSVGAFPIVGYLSNVRFVKGTAVYTAAFTPPTAPLTAITNTSLLLNYTNAGIYDATSKNDLETVGNAQISTTQSKFGGSSMYFDGNGDVLSAPDNEMVRLSSGDFTIECWVYPTANGALYDSGFASYGAASTLAGWFFGMSGSNTGGTLNRLIWSVNYAVSGGAPVYGNAGLPLNTWSHAAVTKFGTTISLFINGILDKTATVTATPTTSSTYKLYVGAASYDPTGTQRSLTGYINDLRITKGIARYTSNFTPPTSAFLTL